jgi:hypothetical protein
VRPAFVLPVMWAAIIGLAVVLARAKDVDPEAIFVFVPGGAQSPAIVKALADRGVDPRKTKVMSQAELTAKWT